jgi:hypothetical protein
MSEELRMKARRKAAEIAKVHGFPIPGEAFYKEMDKILEDMIKEKIKQENEKVLPYKE